MKSFRMIWQPHADWIDPRRKRVHWLSENKRFRLVWCELSPSCLEFQRRRSQRSKEWIKIREIRLNGERTPQAIAERAREILGERDVFYRGFSDAWEFGVNKQEKEYYERKEAN